MKYWLIVAFSIQHKICIFPARCLRKQKKEITKISVSSVLPESFPYNIGLLSLNQFFIFEAENVSECNLCSAEPNGNMPRKPLISGWSRGCCAVDLYSRICKVTSCLKSLGSYFVYCQSFTPEWIREGVFILWRTSDWVNWKRRCEWSCLLRAVTFERIVIFQFRNSC